MDDREIVEAKVKALIERAKTSGFKSKEPERKRSGSSLSKVIRTKEQADFFMKQLKQLRSA